MPDTRTLLIGGRVCFLSTPNGENRGLEKKMVVTGVVSINMSESLVDELFEMWDGETG